MLIVAWLPPLFFLFPATASHTGQSGAFSAFRFAFSTPSEEPAILKGTPLGMRWVFRASPILRRARLTGPRCRKGQSEGQGLHVVGRSDVLGKGFRPSAPSTPGGAGIPGSKLLLNLRGVLGTRKRYRANWRSQTGDYAKARTRPSIHRRLGFSAH